MSDDVHEQLLGYLHDAHSIEEQALAQLREAPKIAGSGGLAEAFSDHLTETEGHEQLTRRLLEGRDEGPSRFKDAVMAVGGKGFVWFARLQPDTPGKLAAHALSYEALEHGSYEMLARTAERAGEQDVVAAARSIAAEEAGHDAAARGPLRRVGRRVAGRGRRPRRQAPQVPGRRPRARGAGDAAARAGHGARRQPRLERVYAEHLEETREHSRLVEERLDALGGKPSMLKDAMMKLGGLNWATFFAAQPDTPGKLAVFARAFEYLEIGGYEQLKRVARRAGDEETAALADRILVQERAAAERLASSFDEAHAAAMQAARS